MGIKGLSNIDFSSLNFKMELPKYEPPNFPQDFNIITAEDLLQALKKNNEDLLELLEQQHQANLALNKTNSRLVLLSIFLAVIPIIFGVLSYIQAEQSNNLFDKQLKQFEIIINRIPPVDNSPSKITPLQEKNTNTNPNLIKDSI